MTVINTNLSSIQSQNSLRITSGKLATAMERLSSGVRINAAKDDAAGLAISTRMTAEIKGLAGAVRNANDGISLTQTAEGALESINNNLQRIRELAVQSSNATNSSSDRIAMNNEARQLVDEIDRVASNASFNGIKLLNGTFSGKALQVGSGNGSNDRITLTIDGAASASLGVSMNASYSTSAGSVTAEELTQGGLSINGVQVPSTMSDGVSNNDPAASAIAKANAINSVSGATGVWATVGAATQAYIAQVGGGTFNLTVNGVEVSGTTTSLTDAVINASEIAAAFNAKAAQTGVTATVTGDNQYTLTAADGRNINMVVNTAGDAGVAESGPSANSKVTGTITLTSSENGITLGGSQAGVHEAIGTAAGTVTMVTNPNIPRGVDGVDLTSVQGSQDALATLDSAINAITNSRAKLGAYQNRLTAAVQNIDNSAMNLQASRSRIMDTDYATETTNLAKAQIIQQAATAMLAQANQSAQSVLALLK